MRVGDQQSYIRAIKLLALSLIVLAALVAAALFAGTWAPVACASMGFDRDVCVNVETSATFFVIELIFIVIGVPLVGDIIDSKRWKPVRSKLVEIFAFECAELADCVILTLAQKAVRDEEALKIFEGAVATHTSERSRDGLEEEEAIVHALEIDYAKSIVDLVKKAVSAIQRTFDLYSVAIEPKMAAPLVAIMEMADSIDSYMPDWFEEGYHVEFDSVKLAGFIRSARTPLHTLADLGYTNQKIEERLKLLDKRIGIIAQAHNLSARLRLLRPAAEAVFIGDDGEEYTPF